MKLALFFAAASVCFGQSASPCISALSAWYLNTGQTTNDPAITATPQYKWAYLNPPLTGCLDADGKLQIGASITAGATGPGAYLTSSTSNVLATGNLTFATQAGQAFVSSEYVALISGTGAYAYGPIVSYAGTALVVNVTEIYAGAGATFASWTIVPTGVQGPAGPQAASPAQPRTCSFSIGDGIDVMTSGVYPQVLTAGPYPGLNAFMGCPNNTGIPWTVTGIHCWTDNIGLASTADVLNNAGVSFLLMPVLCSAVQAGGGAAGALANAPPNLPTSSANTVLASGDAFNFKFVSDGITTAFRVTVDYQ